MKRHVSESVTIPQGISCTYENKMLIFSKGSTTLERKISIPQTEISVAGSGIKFDSKKGNQTQYKSILAAIAHVKNILHGLQEKYVYKLESANVHFPMTLKVEPERVVINNYLGEKTPRFAKIVKGAEVKIDGPKITVTSADIEAAGQTAANLEKATIPKGRDRRIFQDGIYIVEKPGRDA